jgi:hypothetical protein
MYTFYQRFVSGTMKIALTGMPPGFPAYPNHCLSLLAKKRERKKNPTNP